MMKTAAGQGAGADRPEDAAPIFAALGDPVRLAMVVRLCREGPLATTELKRGAGLTRQGLTKHLKVLESAGVVSSGRVGRDREWQLEGQQLAAIRACLDRISAQWDARIERLRAFVEGKD
ncbi:MAG TPA: metalloregulator ArsR/SmtB family transcription factor [Devosiaceae bacterium]|jgi:DNA-binding transcriptional ArsR family regulator|nr:metalloregulator ArsR/SmtB family transcription factor [Devosiaceae bacterium]